MQERLVVGEYFMNRWPGSDTVFTRGNLKDMAPDALTPLTEDLFCTHETAASLKFYNDELGLGIDLPSRDSWISGYFGHLYVNLHCVGEVGERLPGSSARDIYQAYFGLTPDPAWVLPEVDEELEAKLGEEFLAMVSGRAMSINDRVAGQIDRVRGLRPDGEPTPESAVAWFSELCDQLTDSFALLIEAATNASLFFTVVGTALAAADPTLDADVLNALHIDLHDIGSAGSGVAATEIARAISENPAVAEAIEAGEGLDAVRSLDPAVGALVDDFVGRFGHRGPGEIELATDTWRANTTGLLAWCARLGVQTEQHGVDDGDADAAAHLRLDAERRVAGVVGELTDANPIAGLIGLSREAMRSRENSKDPLLYNLDELRLAIDVIASALVASGTIERSDDVFLLTADEIRSAMAGEWAPAGEMQSRRDQFELVQALEVPDIATATSAAQLVATDPQFFLDQGLFPPGDDGEASAQSSAGVTGMGASPGEVTATLRLMHDPFDEFEAGDVLVACTVDPGWAPALAAASAVVLELGGPLSHGAMVARELGIPCVVNATNALSLLVDGALGTVDGSAGTVVLAR